MSVAYQSQRRKIMCPCGCSLHMDQFPFEGDDIGSGLFSPWAGFYWAVQRAGQAYDAWQASGKADSYLPPFSDYDAGHYKSFIVEHARRTNRSVYAFLNDATWKAEHGCLTVDPDCKAPTDVVQEAFDLAYGILRSVRFEDPALVFTVNQDGEPLRIPPQSAPLSSSTFRVYRMFDADNVLLYVGKTNNWTRRMRQHERDQEKAVWWLQVAKVDLEFHETEASMSAAELRAIRTENPLHNKAGRV